MLLTTETARNVPGVVREQEFDVKFNLALTTLTSAFSLPGLTLGNLIYSGNAIKSSDNGNIFIIPDGTGQLIIAADPVSNLGVATKQYVDNKAQNYTLPVSSITGFTSAVDSLIDAQAGYANGLATLDGAGKIPLSQLSIGSTAYLGLWDASVNNPTITSSVGTTGSYYIVGTVGTTTINGISVWNLGDTIIFNGSVWQKSTSSAQVTSVAGRIGNIVLVASDITEGSFANNLISQSSVLQYQSVININSLYGAPNGYVVGTSDSQSLINKTIDASLNNVINVGNSSLESGINASLIANSSVGNTQFQYLSNVTGDIQAQINSKITTGTTFNASIITSGTIANAQISSSSVLQYQTSMNVMRMIGAPQSFIVGVNDNQTLTSKTIDATRNTIINIGGSSLVPGINATFIANGTVNNTQFQYLSNLTAPIQLQLNNKAAMAHTHTLNQITDFTTQVPYCNLNATMPPTQNNDITQGYYVGSRWVDIVHEEEYVCLNNIRGLAIWTETTSVCVGSGISGINIQYNEVTLPGDPFATLDFDCTNGGLTITNVGNGTAVINCLATINDTDANLRNRATHTGTQISATISDFDNTVTDSTHANRHDNPHIVTATQLGLENVVNILDNWTASTTPNVTNDSSQGYILGSKWFDTTNNRIYICESNAAGAAVWLELVSQATGGAQTLLTAITTTDNLAMNLLTMPTISNQAYLVNASIVARRVDVVGEACAFSINALYRNDNGILMEVVNSEMILPDDSEWSIVPVITDSTLIMTCQGQVGKSVSWKCSASVLSV